MKIDVLTLFPKMFESPFEESIIKRAITNKIIELNIYNLRNWAIDSYGTVDDKPFGGGVGMLIKPEPVWRALKQISNVDVLMSNKEKKQNLIDGNTKIVLVSARGKRFDQEKAEELSKLKNIILIAGHYEGFDQRISDCMIDEEISIGDYVLTGGELPAMVIIDSVTRLLAGVLGKDESSKTESFGEELVDGKIVRTIEYPQYTRPQNFMGLEVPGVLVSGDPKKIKNWQIEHLKKSLKERSGQENNP